MLLSKNGIEEAMNSHISFIGLTYESGFNSKTGFQHLLKKNRDDVKEIFETESDILVSNYNPEHLCADWSLLLLHNLGRNQVKDRFNA